MSPPTSTVQVLWRWILRINGVRQLTSWLKSTRDCRRGFCRKIHRLIEVQIKAILILYNHSQFIYMLINVMNVWTNCLECVRGLPSASTLTSRGFFSAQLSASFMAECCLLFGCFLPFGMMSGLSAGRLSISERCHHLIFISLL